MEEAFRFLTHHFSDNVKIKRKIEAEFDRFVSNMDKIVSEEFEEWNIGRVSGWKKKDELRKLSKKDFMRELQP